MSTQLAANTAAFEGRLTRLLQQSGVTLQWGLWDIARVLGNNLMSLTWPRDPRSKMPHKSGFWGKKEGKRAIDDDLAKLFVPMSDPGVVEFFNAEFGDGITENKGKLSRKTDRNRLKRILPNVEFIHDGNQARIQGLHERYRKNGRVKYKSQQVARLGDFEFHNKMYIPKSALSAYSRKRAKSVGKLKGGWVAAIQYFGGKTGGAMDLPAYALKHASGGGYVDNSSSSREGGSVILHNKIPYAERLVRLVIQTAENRTDAYDAKATRKQLDAMIARFNSEKQSAGAA